MELIVINENKLKIIMNEQEMQQYGLDENEFHLCISDTRKILARILHNSPIATGFELPLPNERILLQLYPERQGGCELYVTRLALDEENVITEDSTMKSEESHLLPIYTGDAENKKRLLLCYSFEKLNDIIRSCRELKERFPIVDGSVYFGEDEKYYFILKRDVNIEEKYSISSVLSEFGELKNADHSLLRLCERGRCICETNAIEIFSCL